MAMEDFWLNVANATRVRQPYVHAPDVKAIAREDIRKALDENEVWLQKRSVQGFRKEDWMFLGQVKADQLEQHVEQFTRLVSLRHLLNPENYREELFRLLDSPDFLAQNVSELVSAQASVGKSALDKAKIERVMGRLSERAKPIMEEIIFTLQFDRYRNAAALRVGKGIESRIHGEGWPEELVELRFQTGEDHTGEPGLWIWAILRDGVTDDNERYKSVAEMIDELLSQASRQEAPDLFPFIAFRSESESIYREEAVA